MITIKTPEEIKILREGGKRLAFILYQVTEKAKAGIATIELDILAEKLIKKTGGEPSFKNYKTADDIKPFPSSICVSINNEVVHGIPSKNRILKDGDIVSIDIGMKYKGLYTDIAVTVPIGRVNEKAKRIIKTTKTALEKGIKTVKDGIFIGDIGFVIQFYVKSQGFNVVRDLAGHGVGYAVHEEPEIPNFGQPKTGKQLKQGMVLALEPMVVEAKPDIILGRDNWVWKTKDGLLATLFEHTVVVTKSGVEILTRI
jgi:methionyl aminopeptidase